MKGKNVFCGGCNKAENIFKGLLGREAAVPEEITVIELVKARCDELTKTYGVTAAAEASEAIREAELVLIAVNPPQVRSVTSVLRTLIGEETIVMSIAAGVTIAALESQLGGGKKVVRVMPNTLCQSGSGYSAACINDRIDGKDREFITRILDALGQTMYIEEEMFNTFTAFSCSGPVWLYQTVEALINAGVYVGFGRREAREMVIRNMMGVAQVLAASDVPPAVKVDEMCSPGGVTIEALKSLQEEGFAAAVMTSVTSAVRKANSIE